MRTMRVITDHESMVFRELCQLMSSAKLSEIGAFYQRAIEHAKTTQRPVAIDIYRDYLKIVIREKKARDKRLVL